MGTPKTAPVPVLLLWYTSETSSDKLKFIRARSQKQQLHNVILKRYYSTFAVNSYIRISEMFRYYLWVPCKILNIIQILGLKWVASQVNTRG